MLGSVLVCVCAFVCAAMAYLMNPQIQLEFIPHTKPHAHTRRWHTRFDHAFANDDIDDDDNDYAEANVDRVCRWYENGNVRCEMASIMCV